MSLNLPQAKHQSQAKQLMTSVPLTNAQMRLVSLLNDFAIHQAEYDPEVRQFPAKMMYKVNDELKLALVALLTTCSLLDPQRHGNEAQKFFEDQIKIIQGTHGNKVIDFGSIRPDLVQQSMIPEVIDDWILYRDINGDGIHALMDRKTYMQGLTTYARGGHPVYEFARFYRRFMEDKLAKKIQEQQKVKEIALKSLTDQVIQKQLEQGYSPQQLLDQIISDKTALLFEDTGNQPKRLTKK
ncbi:MAG: hypothetical protein II938_02205 [Alphaproteobacteria bacterium]|nr:hypothetical protein [Alphaproteobacteria bacterium]